MWKRVKNVYDFAIELRKEYVRRAGKDMAVLNAYNEAEEDRAEAAGEPYHYRMTEPMDPENPYLYHDWKFNPEIQPIQMKTYLHESGIMILTFLYVSCILPGSNRHHRLYTKRYDRCAESENVDD